MDVEVGAYKLLVLAVIGVALVIVLGISYTNYGQTKTNMVNANVGAGIQANFTTNAGAVANTAGVNGNYAYYILFMALILGVIIGALIGAARKGAR